MKKNVLIYVLIVFGFLLFSLLAMYGFSKYKFEKQTKQDLTGIQETKLLEFNTQLNEQMALSNQMAHSPLIISYMENPSDENLSRQAMEEVAAYQKSFISNLTFMIMTRI